MTWYRIKNWKFTNYTDELEISVIESEKIFESEITDIVYDTLSDSVVDDMIDEFYGDVEICGYKYSTSLALKSTDAMVYDEMKNECCEMKIEEIIDGMPDKPMSYLAMVNQCGIYWE